MTSTARVLFLCLVLMSVAACGLTEAPVPDDTEELTVVKTATVQRTSFDEEVSLAATIQAWQVATLVPDVPGRVRSVNVRIGERVERGATLLTLVDDDYAQGVLQAEAAVDMANAQLADAESTHRRFVDLKARDAVTTAEFEKVVVGLTLARAQARQAEVGLNVAKDRLADTRLRAPFAGTVVARNVEVGEMLGGPAQLPPIQLADLSKLRVVAAIGEIQAAKVTVGDRAMVEVDALPGQTLQGEVQRVNRLVDPRTRSVKVEAMLDATDERLIHGMTAELLLDSVGDDHLAVPREALLDRDDGTARVMVVDGDTVASRDIQYGRSRTGLVPILAGLVEGEQVLVAGHTRLTDGSRVEIVEGSQP